MQSKMLVFKEEKSCILLQEPSSFCMVYFCGIDWTIAHRLNLTGYQTVAIFLLLIQNIFFVKCGTEKYIFLVFPDGENQVNNISKPCHDCVSGLCYFIDS